MTDVNFFGQIRGAARSFFSSAQQDVQPMLSDGGGQLVALEEPERTALVKLGKSWGAAIPTGSAFTYVAAWPTTRSELVLWNGESGGGPSYVIDRLWMTSITAGATGPVSILGQIIPVGATGPLNVLPSDNTAVLRHQLSGRTNNNYSGNAKLILANTTYAIANQWFLLGSAGNFSQVAGGSVIGSGVEADIKGRIIIPPGAGLGLAGLGSVAAGTAIIGLDWHEFYLNLA